MQKSVQIDSENPLNRPVLWNEAAGNVHPPLGQLDTGGTRIQHDYVAEEYVEAAAEANAYEIDQVKTAKEYADLIYTATEGIRRLGMDPAKVFSLVCDSNDSKFCRPEELDECLKHFQDQGIKVKTNSASNGLIVIRSAEDQTVNDKYYPKEKILKAPCYFAAEGALVDYLRELQEADND